DRLRAHVRSGNLIVLVRLPVLRVDQRDWTERKIAVAHRVRRHGGVLIHEVAAAGAAVLEREVRPGVRVVVEAGDLDGAAEGQTEVLVRISRLGALHLVPKLQRGGVQRRTAEPIVDGALKPVLTAAAPTKLEIAIVVVAAAALIL